MFDVVIIGGGPAGASLGYLLQKAGLFTCIIDKAKFPRKKLCGGLVTEKTKQIYEKIYNQKFECFVNSSNEVALYNNSKKLTQVLTSSTFYFVDRYSFDAHLIDLYKSVGGQLMDGCHDYEVDFKSKTITVNGNTIGYHFLVGADGANSSIRKWIDEKYRPDGFCLETRVEKNNDSNVIAIDFGVIKYGYTWVFPNKTNDVVGIGCIQKANSDIANVFDNYLEHFKGSKEKIMGAFVPFGTYVKKPYKEDILLIGDAAGLVDPLTGEGLYFAFKSACAAFDSIKRWLNQDSQRIGAEYLKNISHIHKLIDQCVLFRKLIYNKLLQKIIFKVIAGRTHIVEFICENLLSDYKISYFNLPKEYLIRRRKRK